MKALTFLILCFASIVLADDFKTINGQEYKNATVSRVEPDGIVITFSGGIVKIPFTELSLEIQKKYGYDSKAAADFQQQTYQTDVLRAHQSAEAGEKRRQELPSVNRSQPQPAPAAPAERQAILRVGQNVPVYTLQQLEVEQFSLIDNAIRRDRCGHPRERTRLVPKSADFLFQSAGHFCLCGSYRKWERPSIASAHWNPNPPRHERQWRNHMVRRESKGKLDAREVRPSSSQITTK